MRAATLASTHADKALEPKITALVAHSRGRAETELRRVRESIELGFEDSLRALRETSLEAERGWKSARTDRSEPDSGEPARSFRELERAMEREADGRRRAIAKRLEQLLDLDRRSPLEMTRTLVATAYFWLE
jgi:hypothetical protein